MITIQVVKEPKEKEYKFSAIHEGQIFLFESNYYLKLKWSEDSYSNAVLITNGEQIFFDGEDTQCYPYKAHISLEREE